MEQSFRALGFRIAAAPEAAIAVGALCVVAGVLLAVRAWQDREDLGDHRFFVALCGLGLAATIAVALPFLHRMADRACERWARSATAADQLSYLQQRCAERF